MYNLKGLTKVVFQRLLFEFIFASFRMSAVAKQIARPALMRGMVAKDTKMGLIGAAITGVVSSVLYKVFVYDARKKQYAEHYRCVCDQFKSLACADSYAHVFN